MTSEHDRYPMRSFRFGTNSFNDTTLPSTSRAARCCWQTSNSIVPNKYYRRFYTITYPLQPLECFRISFISMVLARAQSRLSRISTLLLVTRSIFRRFKPIMVNYGRRVSLERMSIDSGNHTSHHRLFHTLVEGTVSQLSNNPTSAYLSVSIVAKSYDVLRSGIHRAWPGSHLTNQSLYRIGNRHSLRSVSGRQ